jgi:hypothetical protein
MLHEGEKYQKKAESARKEKSYGFNAPILHCFFNDGRLGTGLIGDAEVNHDCQDG